MITSKRKILVVIILSTLITVGLVIFSGLSGWSPALSNWYPVTPIVPTMIYQQSGNWCGPTVLQSAIQYVDYHNDGTPQAYYPTMIPQQLIWNFMKNLNCGNLGGNDPQLIGIVGDGSDTIRKLNIAYDYGADPHALAWALWGEEFTNGHSYRSFHYWIYDNADEGSQYLLSTLQSYQEPVIVAVQNGYHWVLVANYEASQTYPVPTQIHYIQFYDPVIGSDRVIPYADWKSTWFTPYSGNNADPDPSVGPYVPPPNHWAGHYVTVERDGYNLYNSDWALTLSGPLSRNFHVRLPIIKNAR